MTIVNNLPASVRETGLFCCWRYEERNGRKTKAPYNPRTGGQAQSNNPDTFAPLNVAAQVMDRYDGLGVGIFGNLGAIDIDHCLDEQGRYSALAQDVIATVQAYTEISPTEPCSPPAPRRGRGSPPRCPSAPRRRGAAPSASAGRDGWSDSAA